ncbi:MAG: hypothetical protein RL095_4039 [Verrucomicrobiota bacterium]|jgi:CheY-like chemotaxis protein
MSSDPSLAAQKRLAETHGLAQTEVLENLSLAMRSQLHLMMSHLNQIKGDNLSTAQKVHVELARGAGAAASTLLVSFLEQSRSGQGESILVKPRPFLTGPWLEALLAPRRTAARAAGVVLQVSSSLPVALYGDHKRLGRLFSILLDEALTLLGEGRLRFSLHTEIDADPEDGSRPGAQLHFTLIDERRGDEDADNPSSQLLRHAGQLAALLGGNLEINDSDIDSDHFACGSIPMALAAAAECRSIEPTRSRILVVDEDPIMREKAALQISRMGGEPLRAADAITAQVLLENIQFAAVLIDPKTSGAGSLALLRMLRNRELTQMRPRTAVFILGPAGSDTSRHEALKAGADGFLNQPLSFDALSLALDSVLTTRLPQTARVVQQS